MSKIINGEALQILLIEDNLAHAELVKRSFEQHRVSNVITHVQDGQEAVAYLFQDETDKQHKQPHIILLDLRLPKIDGLEVLKQIKSNDKTKSIPVVVLTTSSADKDIAMSYEYSANSYLVKPMDFEKFSELMNDLGYYWLAWNKMPYK